MQSIDMTRYYHNAPLRKETKQAMIVKEHIVRSPVIAYMKRSLKMRHLAGANEEKQRAQINRYVQPEVDGGTPRSADFHAPLYIHNPTKFS